MRIWLSAFIALSLGATTAAADPLRSGAEAVRDRALKDATAYDYIESLSVEVGPRLAGSEAAARARDWGVAKLTALGFSNVHVEPFPITAWLRGPEEAEIVSPRPQKLAIIGLGGSVPTPPEGVEGEVALFHTYADLLAASPGSLTGKIAVVTQPMPRATEGTGYGALNAVRRQGPSEAARRGAIAYLLRSLATGLSREPHTGALNYQPDAPQIPAAALSTIDAVLIDHLAARVALFGAEEMDFARPAFAKAHAADNIVVIGESDIGSDRAWQVQLPAGSAKTPEMLDYAAAIASIGVVVSPDPSRGSGDDTVDLVKAGVPAFAVHQDASRYFDWHHSSEDTLDKVDADQLNQAVATWASFVYIAANSDIDYRALSTAASPPKPAP